MPKRPVSPPSPADTSAATRAAKPAPKPAPAPVSPQPLAALDRNGVPTPLSYDVSEPMAYSGRNYITIDLPTEAFAVRAVDPEQVLAQNPTAHLAPTAVHGAAQISEPTNPGPTASGLTGYGNAVAGALAVSHGAALAGARVSGPDLAPTLLPGGVDPVDPPEPPDVTVIIDTPAPGSTASGTSKGVTVQAAGRWSGSGFPGTPTITLSVNGQAPVPATATPAGTWSLPLTLTSAGQYTLTVQATATGDLFHGRRLTGTDAATVTITAALSPDQTPAPALPTLVVADPRPNQVVPAPSGQASVTVTGQASVTPAGPLTVTVTDTTTGNHQSVTVPANAKPDFSVTLPLLGLGVHQLVAVASTATGVKSTEVAFPVTLSMRPAMARILNRLMIVETLNLTSYLGAYGAGRLLKTFSLLAGEKTTISLKTYRNDVETSKQGASILDSAASEAQDDFENAVSDEQTDKDSAAQSSEFKVGANASASWGFGSASINATYSGAANSAREEAVKNVSTATRKHALKASTNRSVTVNTETASAVTSTQDDSTVREIANINVARTLNYVFRQMNQEHIVLYHLTNARIGYYTEDIPLDSSGHAQRDADGNVVVVKNYQEVTLPELNSLLNQIVDPNYAPKIRSAVVNALSGIPDYQDQLQSLVETAAPTDASGNPVPEAAYLRVVRNLHTVFKDPYSNFTVQVPGIVLGFDHIVQRTDGVFVEAILGQGDALDPYSHGLQDATVADKQATIAQAQLGASLVSSHDDAGAALYQKVFYPPVPAVQSDGAGSASANGSVAASTDRAGLASTNGAAPAQSRA